LALAVGSKKGTSSNIFRKLPRLSTTVWLLIVSALILIFAVPLFLGYFGEASSQSLQKNLLNQLQTRYNDLQKQSGSQAALLSEVTALTKDVEKAKLSYGNVDNSIEVSRDLIELAWKYDITINSMNMAQVKTKYSGIEYPVLVYVISMTGQVPAFQNFLIAVGNKLPSSQVSQIIIQPAVEQGKLDKATINLQVVCNR
jgi:hypothetical protein